MAIIKSIEYTNDGSYRPNSLIINGELAGRDIFLFKHGYSWKSSPSGNILFYRTKSGKEYRIKQSFLDDAHRKIMNTSLIDRLK